MEQHSTCTATAGADSHEGPLVRVALLVTVSCAMVATLAFVGSGHRRTSRSAALRSVVWLALILCYPAVSYTMGLMQSGGFGSNGLFVVWACFLLGCADGVFASSAGDSDQEARAMLNQALQVVYVLLLLLSHMASLEPQVKVLVLLLWTLSVAKLGMRLRSRPSAGRERALTVDNWLISKYMAHEHVRSVWDFDPDTMKGYKYVVTGEKDAQDGCAGFTLEVTDDLVTVDRVWQHEGSGSLLSKDSPVSGQLKDLCLSFALFKLLRRRLSGSPLHERDDIRTLVLVRRGLAGGDHERMYRVIEAELGFLFDFLYKRHQSTKLSSLIRETAAFAAAMALSLSALFTPALLRYHNHQSGNTSLGTNIDVWLTRGVIALFMILELFQYISALLLLLLSDWRKVELLCLYVRKPSWQGHPIVERLLRLLLLFRPTRATRQWSNSVGHYSLLHACCLEHERSRMKLLHSRIRGLLAPRTSRTAARHRSLPVAVKRAIHLLLRSEWLTNLKYGDRTLQRNDMLQDLDWSTSRYKHGAVGSILIWHIATTICAGAAKLPQNQKLAAVSSGQSSQRPADGGAVAEDREVATTLSNYCAYLLFQAPELVTDQAYDVRRLIEALQLRIRRFLEHKGCRSMDDMLEKLSGFEPRKLESGYEESILGDGVKLGDQLSGKIPDEAARWKVLSEMWVELLLSAAPSDNVTAHVKRLATGGEFVTHLWALLTHAGIIDKPAKPYYGSSAHQRTECYNDEDM